METIAFVLDIFLVIAAVAAYLARPRIGGQCSDGSDVEWVRCASRKPRSSYAQGTYYPERYCLDRPRRGCPPYAIRASP